MTTVSTSKTNLWGPASPSCLAARQKQAINDAGQRTLKDKKKTQLLSNTRPRPHSSTDHWLHDGKHETKPSAAHRPLSIFQGQAKSQGHVLATAPLGNLAQKYGPSLVGSAFSVIIASTAGKISRHLATRRTKRNAGSLPSSRHSSSELHYKCGFARPAYLAIYRSVSSSLGSNFEMEPHKSQS